MAIDAIALKTLLGTDMASQSFNDISTAIIRFLTSKHASDPNLILLTIVNEFFDVNMDDLVELLDGPKEHTKICLLNTVAKWLINILASKTKINNYDQSLRSFIQFVKSQINEQSHKYDPENIALFNIYFAIN